jgi:hypothetical protein
VLVKSAAGLSQRRAHEFLIERILTVAHNPRAHV